MQNIILIVLDLRHEIENKKPERSRIFTHLVIRSVEHVTGHPGSLDT